MATMYSQVVFPQALNGFVFGPASGSVVSYSGIAPATATSAGAIISKTWNPASANAADRTQWWPDTAGTMTYSQVMLAVSGLSGLVSNQIASQLPVLQTTIESSVSLAVNGTDYSFSLSKDVQTLNLLHVSIANLIKFSAGSWTAGASVAQNSVIISGGEYYEAAVGGTSGSTAPVFPAASLTSIPSVSDGDVTWRVVEFHVPLSNGNIVYLNVTSLESLLQATKALVASNYDTYTAMQNKLNAVSTAALVWTSGASVPAGSYLVQGSTLYVSGTTAGVCGTTAPTFSTAVSSVTTDGSVSWTCLGDLMAYIESQTF